jgi:hypothetical protein
MQQYQDKRDKDMRLNKRDFLKISMVSGLSTYIEGITGLEKLVHAQEGPPPFLDEKQRSVLRGMITHLIPADKEPGALELGLGSMIETFLRVTPKARPLVKPGLKGVEESTKAQFAKSSFLELTPAERDELFKAMKEERLPKEIWKEISSKEFFSTIRMFTVAVYYSNPKVRRFIGYSGPAQPKGYQDYDVI